MINKYISRDENNVINGIYSRPQEFMEEPYEKLPEDDPEILAFDEEPTNEELYDATMDNQKLIKALVLSILDGSVKEGVTPQAAKTAILSKM